MASRVVVIAMFLGVCSLGGLYFDMSMFSIYLFFTGPMAHARVP